MQPQRRSLIEPYVFTAEVFQNFIFLITPRQRASTTGLVISGYGLSAFLFSTISQFFFSGDASQLLLLLSLGSSFPMILGFFFVRPVPLPEENPNREAYSEASPSIYEQRNNSRTPLLNHDNIEDISGQDDDDAQIGADVDLSSSLCSQNDEIVRRSSSHGAAMGLDMSPNVYGKKLWCSSDFWLLSSILFLRAFACLFTILTYLFNVLLVVGGSGAMCMSRRTNTLSSLMTIL